MCGKQAKVVQPVQRDPVAEQREAEAKAQLAANEELAGLRKRRGKSSLLTRAAGSIAQQANSASLIARPVTPSGG